MSTTSDPRVGAIRLAWWRERLEQMDTGDTVPAEPRLQAVANELLPRGVTGRELSQLEDAWLSLLEPIPWGERQAQGLKLRGQILFGIGARLLGANADGAERAGALWSLIDGADHCSEPQSRGFLREQARLELSNNSARMPGRLRPLTVLAAIAAIDLVEGGGLNRLFAAALHRAIGILPRS